METMRFIIFPIFAAASAGTVGSFLWYALFLKKDSLVIKEDAIEMESLKSLKNVFRVSFLAQIFSAVAIFFLIGMFQIRSFAEGLNFIVAIWFFLVALSGIKKVVIEKKSLENFILGAGHDCINILIIFSVLLLSIRP